MIELDSIQWSAEGLVPIITQDVDGRLLMLAYTNREALEKTVEMGWMHYWSRSRQRLWKKGETSGHTQRLVSLKLDCDGDAILARVVQNGPVCHTGSPSCFGRMEANVLDDLWSVFADRVQHPKPDSYVNKLLSDERHLRQKVGEEGVEVALADSDDALIREAADLIFHLSVLLFARRQSWSEVLAELERRRRSS
jgi:phosphoribosyl-ATP pyrophosphohydrolase/phosphoribosyl-AMP cyclohydrolase